MAPAVTNVNDYNAQLIEEFRSNGGQLSGHWEGASLMLLGTTGAKSGQPRTNPVAFSRFGDDYVVIASKAGAPTSPDWYYNLIANPEVIVEVPGETFTARARVTTGDERRRLFDAQAELMPGFKDYETKTTREIPVVVLERVA